MPPKRKSANQLRVRMYRVGFGDFFLVTVPVKNGSPQHIVIDCGVTPGKTRKGDIGTIQAAVSHMAKETGGKLALIIATHRHQDHIVGFSRSADVFRNFTVDAVWMSAWETDYDPNEKKKAPKKKQISEMQDEMASLASSMQEHLALAAGQSIEVDEALAMLENATGEETMSFAAAGKGKGKMAGKGGGTNAASLAFLKTGLGVTPEYYAAGDRAKLPKSLKDAGLTAQILGPPPIGETDFMDLMDLKKTVGQYLGEDTAAVGGTFTAFGPQWRSKDFLGTKTALREWGRVSPKNPLAAMEGAIKASQPVALFTAAKTLDKFLNNQSLVVLFEFAGKHLLFAGDAQGGNWEYWMYGGTPDKAPSIEKLKKESKAILGNLDFYKVGHHGSTNATPISAVEAMDGNFVSMCSTQFGSFGSVENNSEVPRIPLMEALAKKSKVVRSDHITVTVAGSEAKPVAGGPAKLPKAPPGGRFEKGSIYIDYFL